MNKFSDPLFWFLIVTTAVWLYRIRVSLNALRQIPRVMPVALKDSGEWVTVVVPAKNEELNIKDCVEALRNQTYKNLQVLVVNNGSTDKTEAILRELDVPLAGEKECRVVYLNSPETPAGWTGKNFAIHSAIPYARGSWLLFTDADTRHEPSSIASSLEHAKSHDLEFLSLLPRCITASFFEHMVQACAMGFLGLWFPIPRVNDPKSALYFANGQYLLMKRTLYEKTGGHIAVKDAFLEDFALMKKSKELKARAQCAMGTEIYGTRMYDSPGSLWNGWRRIYLHAFERNTKMLLSKFFILIFFSVIPFTLFIPVTFLAFQNPAQYAFAWGIFIPLLLIILATSWKTYGIVKSKRGYSLLHPFAAAILAMILLDAAGIAASNQKTVWR